MESSADLHATEIDDFDEFEDFDDLDAFDDDIAAAQSADGEQSPIPSPAPPLRHGMEQQVVQQERSAQQRRQKRRQLNHTETLLAIALDGQNDRFKTKVYELVIEFNLEPDDPLFLVLVATGRLETLLEERPQELSALFDQWENRVHTQLGEYREGLEQYERTAVKAQERAIAPTALSHPEEDLSLDDVLPPVPPGLMQMANWFRVGFALFVLLSSLLGLSGCEVQASVPWQVASRILPHPVLEQVLMEQTSIPKQKQEDVLQAMQAWVVGGNEGKLVMLHYNTAEVCGAMGCLYNGVWLKDDDEASIVFSSYLNLNLPRTLALFSPVNDAPDQASRPLPCFQVNQMEGANLRQTTFCLQGEAYHSVRSVVTPFVRS